MDYGCPCGVLANLAAFGAASSELSWPASSTPVDIERRVGGKKDDTGSRTQTSGTMNVMSRQVREIAVTSDQALVVLHLNFKGAANDHGGLAGRMPVKRRHNLEQTWQESRMVLCRGRPESALSCVRKDAGRALYPKCAQSRPAASGAAV
jgi:hypothetical protein